MTVITRENAPIIQSLLTMVNLDKPEVGCTIKVLTGKHKGKLGIVQKHIRSRFENPYRYGNEMSHHMTDARGREGYCILIKQGDGGTFWTKANNVIVCCTKEWYK